MFRRQKLRQTSTASRLIKLSWQHDHLNQPASAIPGALQTGQAVQLTRSASFRRDPQQQGTARAIAQEKTPTQMSWGFGIGGAGVYRT